PLAGNFPRPDDRTLVMVIDALDEATQHHQNPLASLIASEFDKTPSWLRLIVTSRPEPDVTYLLQGFIPYELDACAQGNEKDLRTYLGRELQPFTAGTEIAPAIVDTVIAKSEGIFLYATMIREELGQQRLSMDRLEAFPQGLSGVYAGFFSRQFP